MEYLKILTKQNSKSGSSIIEASIIIPILVIIIVSIIKLGTYYETVSKESSIKHQTENIITVKDTLTNTEDILRAKRAGQ